MTRDPGLVKAELNDATDEMAQCHRDLANIHIKAADMFDRQLAGLMAGQRPDFDEKYAEDLAKELLIAEMRQREIASKILRLAMERGI